MKQKYFFLCFLFFASLNSFSQTTTLTFKRGTGATSSQYYGGGSQVTLDNLTTCQTSISATLFSNNYNGWNGWTGSNFNYYVNETFVGSGNGTITVDLTPYIPITSVKIVDTQNDNWNLSFITLDIASSTVSIPASGPTVVSNITYVQGDVANPLSATLNGTGSVLKWYSPTNGENYTATAPTPSTATVGTTSYWVAQANASGCESVRSEIVVTVLPNTPATHLNFDGTNDYVSIPPTAINNLPGGKIEGWVRVKCLENRTMCSKQSNVEASYATLTVGGGPAANGKIHYQSNNSASVISNTILATGQWYHVAIVFNGSQAKIYINGVLDNTVVGNFSLPNDTTVTATTIGAWLGDGGGQYFNGDIEEFRVWNVERTASEIANARNCELLPSQTTGLVTYYKFNHGIALANNPTQTTLADATANIYNGTLNNFALSGSTSNWLAGSVVAIQPVAPTASSTQYFCASANPKVANLNPAPSTTVKWFTTATGGIALATNTTLTNSAYYVANVNASGCEGTRTAVNVIIRTSPTATSTQTNVTCNNGLDGTIDLTPAGGTAPYTFNWGGGVTTEDRTGLAVGTYNVTITDVNGCTVTHSVTITQPVATITYTTNITNVSCNGGSNGGIDLTITAGTAPYTFDWGSGITTEDRTGLAPGVYTCTITDAASCIKRSFTITEPTVLTATTSHTNSSTLGATDGTATVTPADGTPGYTYLWSPGGATTQTATGLGTGTYACTITDANGCQITRNVTVNPVGTHLNYDATDDFISVPTAAINNLQQGTISTWINLNSAISGICEKKLGNGSRYASLSTFEDSNFGFFSSISYINGASSFIYEPYLAPGEWNNITITFTNTEAKIYVNGILNGNFSGDFSIPNDTSGTVKIGNTEANGALNGNMDEFRVWNVVLPDTDIQDLYNCELQASQTGLMAYYKFNHGYGDFDNSIATTVSDSSGNGNNGTLTNFALTGTASNWKAESPVVTGNTCARLSTNTFDIAGKFKVYPNPTNNNITIEFDNLTNAQLEVFDINGRLLMDSLLKVNQNLIDVSNFPSGMYLFKVTSDEGTATSKVIKN